MVIRTCYCKVPAEERPSTTTILRSMSAFGPKRTLVEGLLITLFALGPAETPAPWHPGARSAAESDGSVHYFGDAPVH
jgi:hypothetical protein